MTRSETSWCGDAAFGPEPTITKSTWTWPSARMASAIFAPTWRSVRPGLSHPGTLACTRSIASPAALSAATSAADLRIRSGDSTVLASRCSAVGKTSLNASTCSAHMRSDRATERGSPTALEIIPNGFSVSPQVTISKLRAPAGEACAALSSSRGTSRNGSPSAGTARQVSRSSCLAS